MATAVIISLLTDYDLCDGAGANPTFAPTSAAPLITTVAVDPLISIQGGNSVAIGQTATGGANPPAIGDMRGGISQNGGFSGVGKHIFIWANTLYPVFPKAAHGIAIIVSDTSNRYGVWGVAGDDTYPGGGWELFVINSDGITGPAFDLNEGADPARITLNGIGIVVNPLAGGETFLSSIFYDAIRISGAGNGIKVTGGTGVGAAAVTLGDIVAADTAALGIVTQRKGAYVLNGEVQFGDAGATTYIEIINEMVVFADHRVASGFYKLSGITGLKTSFIARNSFFKPAGTSNRFDFDMSGLSGVDVLDVSDCTFFQGGAFNIPALGSVVDSVFNNCLLISPTTAVLTGSLITGSTAPVHMQIVSTSHGVQVCDFVSGGSGHALEITNPGTYTFNKFTFTGYGLDATTDAAVYNNSGGAVTINVVGGDSPTVKDGVGASTTVNQSVNFDFTNVVAGSLLYVEATTGGPLAAGTPIISAVTVPGTTFTQSIPYTGDQPFRTLISNGDGTPNYAPILFDDTLTNTGFSRRLSQQLDE